MKKYHLLCYNSNGFDGFDENYFGSYETLDLAKKEYIKNQRKNYEYADIMTTKKDGSLCLAAFWIEHLEPEEQIMPGWTDAL